jgi:hypothetical protein
MSHSRDWESWQGMIRRCYNPNFKGYAGYGAKGITVCERWRNSFTAFVADMGPRPPGKSLDRFPDPAGNYEPENCRWATPLEQRHNRISNIPPRGWHWKNRKKA